MIFLIEHIIHICALKVSPKKLSTFLLVKQSRVDVGKRGERKNGGAQKKKGGRISTTIYISTGVLKFKIYIYIYISTGVLKFKIFTLDKALKLAGVQHGVDDF